MCSEIFSKYYVSMSMQNIVLFIVVKMNIFRRQISILEKSLELLPGDKQSILGQESEQ